MKYGDVIDKENEQSFITKEPALQLEASTAEKIAYLREHLDSSTVEYLDSLDFMLDKPFPYDDYDEHWMDEADEDNPPVSNDVIMHDREVWLNAI